MPHEEEKEKRSGFYKVIRVIWLVCFQVAQKVDSYYFYGCLTGSQAVDCLSTPFLETEGGLCGFMNV